MSDKKKKMYKMMWEDTSDDTKGQILGTFTEEEALEMVKTRNKYRPRGIGFRCWPVAVGDEG